jgi:hypothetical protein
MSYPSVNQLAPVLTAFENITSQSLQNSGVVTSPGQVHWVGSPDQASPGVLSVRGVSVLSTVPQPFTSDQARR